LIDFEDAEGKTMDAGAGGFDSALVGGTLLTMISAAPSLRFPQGRLAGFRSCELIAKVNGDGRVAPAVKLSDNYAKALGLCLP
jgi:hypothetical protein